MNKYNENAFDYERNEMANFIRKECIL